MAILAVFLVFPRLVRHAASLRERVGLRVFLNGLGRHAVAAVDPTSKILKLAALAAEGNPGCECWLTAANDTHASRHNRTFY
jgi:hypothetical protein